MVGHSSNPDNQEAEAGGLKVQYSLRLPSWTLSQKQANQLARAGHGTIGL